MLDLSPQQIALLERIARSGFTIVAFPLYASSAGVRRGNCAALLAPVPQGGMRFFGEPCWMVGDNLSVRARRDSRDLFAWKKQEVEATAERLAALADFRRDLEKLLAALA